MPDDYYPAPGYVAPALAYDQERGVCLTGYPPGGTPARDPEPAPPPKRLEQRGGYLICVVCGLAVEYCKGHTAKGKP